MPKRGVIFASDERLYYCGLFLQENGYEVQIVRTPEEWIPEKVRVSDLDFVFLPIRGTEDGSIQMNGTRMDLRPLLEELKPEAKVLAGLWSDYVRFLPCSFVCYQEDLEFAAKNSLLTAEGVLHLLLRKTPRSLFSYTYDLLPERFPDLLPERFPDLLSERPARSGSSIFPAGWREQNRRREPMRISSILQRRRCRVWWHRNLRDSCWHKHF